MKLIDEWREVVSHSLSFWLGAAAALLFGGSELAFSVWGIELDPYWLGVTLLVLVALIPIGRIIDQDASRPWRERFKIVAVILVAMLIALTVVPRAFGAPATEAQTMEIAVPFVAQNEGLRLVAYKPFVWDRWTICYGETHNVRPDMTATKDECDQMLLDRLIIERNTLHRYFSPETIDQRLPPTRDASFVDLSHNCGPDGIGTSTSVRRLNAGDIPGSCEAQTWWDRGGNRVLVGLVQRRTADYKLCMQAS